MPSMTAEDGNADFPKGSEMIVKVSQKCHGNKIFMNLKFVYHLAIF